MDMLSSLPQDLINVILVRLPIREAIRTSILSRDWRHRWTTISHLTFDNYTVPSSYSVSRRVSIIYQILFHHRSQIQLFQLSYFLKRSPHIDCWIHLLSTRSIKELVLAINDKDDDGTEEEEEDYDYLEYYNNYNVPSYIFSCRELTLLELRSCKFEQPPSLLTQVFDAGFPNLKELGLWSVKFPGGEFVERLIGGCPLLERLTLWNMYGITSLRISAPSLRDVCIVGDFGNLCFENAPLAVDVSVILFCQPPRTAAEQMEHARYCNMVKILGGLLSVKKLKLGFSLKFLTAGHIPNRLPVFFNDLKKLKLNVDFGDVKEILAALCLLKSSPNVEKLRVLSCSRKGSIKLTMDFWEEQEKLGCVLNHLRIVKMKCVSTDKDDLEFMKFILANAPMLDTIVLKIGSLVASESTRSSILKKLRQTRKASAQAQIIYLDS